MTVAVSERDEGRREGLAERPWLRGYEPDVPSDVELPDISLAEGLQGSARRFASQPALHFLGTTISYRKLSAHADRFAVALASVDCRPGDVVAINLPNVPQFLVAAWGAWRAGCAVSGVSPLLSPEQMVRQLEDSEARVLVTLDAVFERRLRAIANELKHLQAVIVTDALDYLSWHKRLAARLLPKTPRGRVSELPLQEVLTFQRLLGARNAEPPPRDVRVGDTALLQYTDGSARTPKGAVLTHRNAIANLVQITTWLGPEVGAEVFLSAVPFFHQSGLVLGLAALLSGGAQVLVPNPGDTRHLVKELARWRPTILGSMPSLYRTLARDADFRKLDFSRLRYAVSGAAPYPPAAMGEIEEVIGAGRLIETYGLTETCSVVAMTPGTGARKPGSVGLPLPSTQVRLVDLETGTREVDEGETGELIVRGPQVMRGYWKQPEATSTALRSLNGDRWLYTGDVAQFDGDGYLHVVDRVADLLNVGRRKVYPRAVEEIFNEHPAVRRCAIIGFPHPVEKGNDVVQLVVQLAPDHAERERGELAEDLNLFALERLEQHQIPRVIEFVPDLPLTALGKVDRAALR